MRERAPNTGEFQTFRAVFNMPVDVNDVTIKCQLRKILVL